MRFAAAEALVAEAIRTHASPAAVAEVGRSSGVLWQHAAGSLSYGADAPRTSVDTIFDLASLTKVIATTSLVMRLVERGRLALDTTLMSWLPEWVEDGRGEIRLRHLLDHSSGLPGHARLWERASGRAQYAQALLEMPLERPPGTAAVYSDLGFILIGLLLERCEQRALDVQFAEFATEIPARLTFGAPELQRVAPTEDDPWRGRVVRGEVHDENAAALGGVAGHAGLFGSAPAVGAFARLVLRTFRSATALGTPALMEVFSTPSAVVGSSRALGWDTMRPTSSCGRLLSPSSIGHTGFTGTSLWIDHARDLYVVLLANRVHPARTNEAWLGWRPRIHEAIVHTFDRR